MIHQLRAVTVAAMTITLSSCAYWSDSTNKAVTCAVLGAVVGGAVAGGVDDDSSEGSVASGAAAGGVIGGVLCGAVDTEEPTPPARQERREEEPERGPVDSDGDGVTDDLDICPNTAPHHEVDESGCPVLKDADGDGVTDDRDRCPDTPAGTEVDVHGCPAAGESVATLSDIHFAYNKATLAPTARRVLDEVATVMTNSPEMRLSVEGHTDSVGSTEYNLSLSRRRAISAMMYLVRQRGISENRLTVVAKGESSPVASNDTESGRAKNRRVNFVVQ